MPFEFIPDMLHRIIAYGVLPAIAYLLFCLDCKGFSADLSRRPNIVLILADDWVTAIGCYGQKQILTPNIDSCAREGLRHAGICRQHRCASVAVLPDDRLPHRACPRSRQRAEALAAGRRDGGRGPEEGWLRDRPRRQMGPRRGRIDRCADQEGLRLILRLSQPGARPQLLSRILVAERRRRRRWKDNVVVKGVATKRAIYSADPIAQRVAGFHRQEQGSAASSSISPRPCRTPTTRRARKAWRSPATSPTRINRGRSAKNHAAMITRLDADVGRVMQKLSDLKLDENTIVFFRATTARTRKGAAIPSSSKAAAPAGNQALDDRGRHSRADDRPLAWSDQARRQRPRLGLLGLPADR